MLYWSFEMNLFENELWYLIEMTPFRITSIFLKLFILYSKHSIHMKKFLVVDIYILHERHLTCL